MNYDHSFYNKRTLYSNAKTCTFTGRKCKDDQFTRPGTEDDDCDRSESSYDPENPPSLYRPVALKPETLAPLQEISGSCGQYSSYSKLRELREQVYELKKMVRALSDTVQDIQRTNASKDALKDMVHKFLNTWRMDFVCWNGSPWYRHGTRCVCIHGAMDCNRIHCVHSVEEVRDDVIAYIQNREGSRIPLLDLISMSASRSRSLQCRRRAETALGMLADLRVTWRACNT